MQLRPGFLWDRPKLLFDDLPPNRHSETRTVRAVGQLERQAHVLYLAILLGGPTNCSIQSELKALGYLLAPFASMATPTVAPAFWQQHPRISRVRHSLNRLPMGTLATSGANTPNIPAFYSRNGRIWNWVLHPTVCPPQVFSGLDHGPKPEALLLSCKSNLETCKSDACCPKASQGCLWPSHPRA